MAIKPEDVAGMRYAAQIPKAAEKSAAKPKTVAKPAANTPKTPTSKTDSISTVDERTKIQEGLGLSALAEPKTVFLPIATIITQNGEEIAVDATGRAEDGSVPVGTTKPVDNGQGVGGGGGGDGTGNTGGGIQDNSKRQSAYDLLFDQFSKYGLGSLVEPLKNLITDPGVGDAEFTIRLRETPAYQKRFAANAERIKKGLTALDEGDYLGLEDQYQNVMRNYGLPASYYAKGDLGRQESFEKLIANDVSNAELEDRIMTAQDRVLKANPEVLNALKTFYGSSINNGDILAYALDPVNALKDIQRKVTAAEIGGAAAQAGLTTGMSRAEELAAAGVNKAEAQQGFQTVAQVAPRGTQLAEIYKQQPYGQTQAEQEVFNLAGSVEAQKQRKKLAGLEQAAFGAKSGAAQGALQRERAGNL